MTSADPIEIDISGGIQIVVTLNEETVVVRCGDQWVQRLTREQAWELAEALDAVATGGALTPVEGA